MHLDLSGRELPAGRQIEGEEFVVENLYLAASRAYRDDALAETRGSRPPRLAWFATDDPLPLVSFGVRQLWMSLAVRVWRP
jgi:hypothetical protein